MGGRSGRAGGTRRAGGGTQRVSAQTPGLSVVGTPCLVDCGWGQR